MFICYHLEKNQANAPYFRFVGRNAFWK